MSEQPTGGAKERIPSLPGAARLFGVGVSATMARVSEEYLLREIARVQQGNPRYRERSSARKGSSSSRDRRKAPLHPDRLPGGLDPGALPGARDAGRRRGDRHRDRAGAGPLGSWPTTTRSRPAPGARRPCRRSCGFLGEGGPVPDLLYLVDAAGGCISEQDPASPRHRCGWIFSATRSSSSVWCRSSASGSARCGGPGVPAGAHDVVIMVDGKASMYSGCAHGQSTWRSARRLTRKRGRARMHTGDVRAAGTSWSAPTRRA